MITLQMMKGTGPYNQMQRYIADVHKDLTPQQRAGKFTALLKKFVSNANTYDKKYRPQVIAHVRSINTAFAWLKTPEGLLWQEVNRFSAAPMVNQPKVKPQPAPVAVQPAVVEQLKPAVPALVWPKGFYICVQLQHEPFVRFINEEGQCVNGRFSEWAAPQNFHRWQQKWPTYKRPETPLPNGLQWEEDYTHFTPEVAGGAFIKKEGFKFIRGAGEPWINDKAFEQWLGKATTIARYPDNQPLILDVPPQAPVRPVEALVVGAVGQPGPVENVAVKAPVEAPKPKKAVGWWK